MRETNTRSIVPNIVECAKIFITQPVPGSVCMAAGKALRVGRKKLCIGGSDEPLELDAELLKLIDSSWPNVSPAAVTAIFQAMSFPVVGAALKSPLRGTQLFAILRKLLQKLIESEYAVHHMLYGLLESCKERPFDHPAGDHVAFPLVILDEGLSSPPPVVEPASALVEHGAGRIQLQLAIAPLSTKTSSAVWVDLGYNCSISSVGVELLGYRAYGVEFDGLIEVWLLPGAQRFSIHSLTPLTTRRLEVPRHPPKV